MAMPKWTHIEYGYNDRISVTDAKGYVHEGTVTQPIHLLVAHAENGNVVPLEDADAVYRSDKCRFMMCGFRKGEEYALA